MLLALLAPLGPAPAHAQLYEDIRRALDLSPDPLARSPRHVAMGGITLVVPDLHQRIDLWEYAGNPAGLVSSDSATTLELHPGTTARSSLHDLPAGDDRQDFALRDTRLGYEAWRRASGETAYGVIGDYGSLRFDQPYSTDIEHRTKITVPNTMGVISGRAPFLFPDHLRYGFRLNHRFQSSDDDYRAVVRNGAGEWVDQDGPLLAPPDFFAPNHYGVRTLGGGAGLAWVFGAPATVAVGMDHLVNRIEGRNDGGRYSSEIREDRPFTMFQGTVTGHVLGDGGLGRGLEYIADAHSWSSTSDQRWAFTLSGGAGQLPVTGRGHLLDRAEDGNTVGGRIRWSLGSFELGAGYNRFQRTVTLTAPGIDEVNSFNSFRNALYYKVGVDTLTLPDSVLSDEVRDDSWDRAVAVAIGLPIRDGRLAVEYHQGESTTESDRAGPGAQGTHWDVRTGLELRAAPTLLVRGGYRYTSDDRDTNTEQNEYIGHTATAGLGYRPANSVWTVEAGYGVEWLKGDFGDPTRQRSSAQRLLVRLRWEL